MRLIDQQIACLSPGVEEGGGGGARPRGGGAHLLRNLSQSGRCLGPAAPVCAAGCLPSAPR